MIIWNVFHKTIVKRFIEEEMNIVKDDFYIYNKELRIRSEEITLNYLLTRDILEEKHDILKSIKQKYPELFI